MSDLRVIGIDPGPIPGIVVLEFDGTWMCRANALQCTADIAADLVDVLLLECQDRVLVQVERFVTGHRAGRSSTASAGAVTRDLVGQIQRVVTAWGPSTSRGGAVLLQPNAGRVKPWATDTRLEAAGLLEVTKGMRHARDAARHALFAAVHHGGIPDPLSKEWNR